MKTPKTLYVHAVVQFIGLYQDRIMHVSVSTRPEFRHGMQYRLVEDCRCGTVKVHDDDKYCPRCGGIIRE